MGDTGYYDEGAYAATFLVEVDGQEIGRFTEVQGLSVEVGVEDVVEGGVNGYTHKLPKAMTWPNLVLKRGLTQTDNLLDWLRRSSGDGFAENDHQLERSTAAVTLMSSGGERLRSWNFEGAFPIRWTGPSFAVTSNDVAVEELEIAHHGFRASKPR